MHSTEPLWLGRCWTCKGDREKPEWVWSQAKARQSQLLGWPKSLGFSVPSYGKPKQAFLANPIHLQLTNFWQRGPRVFNGERVVSLTNEAETTGYLLTKEWSWTYFIPYRNINSKWIFCKTSQLCFTREGRERGGGRRTPTNWVSKFLRSLRNSS